MSFPGAPKGGQWKGEATGDGLFTGTLALSTSDGTLALRVRLAATRAEARQYHVRLASPFDPAAWQRQFYPELPYLVLKPDETLTHRYLAREDDATPWRGWIYYPFGVLENAREFLFWGAMDLGRYCVLTPNATPRSLPCLTLRPVQVSAGQTLPIEIALRRFAKPACRYRDVLRWYLAHAEDSDPLTAGLLRWRERPARTVGRGVLFGWDARIFGGPAWTPVSALFRNSSARYLWFMIWNAWDESYPTTGEWFIDLWSRTDASRIRDQIRELRAQGFAPLLYCWQFLTDKGVHDGRPPLSSWLASDERGSPLSWGGPHPVKAEAQAVVGAKEVQYRMADFGNAAFREWYVSRVKACVEAYNPSGIAWDMGGWHHSRANPPFASAYGMVRVQADIWSWLQEKYPDKVVVTNEAAGGPSQLFAHGILIEGGSWAGKGELDYEAAKAFRTTIIAYEKPYTYLRSSIGLAGASVVNPGMKGVDATRYPYLAVRYRARNIASTDEAALTVSEGLTGKDAVLLRCRDLVADGEWHTAVVRVTAAPAVRWFVLELHAGPQGDANLWVERIGFTDRDDGSAAAAAAGGLNRFPLEVRQVRAEDWETRPEANSGVSAGLAVEDGVGRFSVRNAGKSMKWAFSGLRAVMAQELMQVMAWGACAGGHLRGDLQRGLPELYRFSAEAMGVPLLTDSDSVVVAGAPAISASAWADGGRLLVAAFNAGQTAAKGRVVIRLPSGGTPPEAAQVALLSPEGAVARVFPTRLAGRPGRRVEIPLALEARQGALVSAPALSYATPIDRQEW